MSHRPLPQDTAGLPDPVAGRPAARGWASWVVFAGLLLILVGAGHALEGVLALSGHAITEPPLLDDLSTWGVAHLLLAVVMGLTGLGLLAGAQAARVCAVLIAALSLLANVAFSPAFSAGSAIVVVLDLVVIYAVTVHGDELRSPTYY